MISIDGILWHYSNDIIDDDVLRGYDTMVLVMIGYSILILLLFLLWWYLVTLNHGIIHYSMMKQ